MSDERRERVALAIGRARFPKYGPGPASEYDRKLADAALAAIDGPATVSEAEVRRACWTYARNMSHEGMRAVLSEFVAARNAGQGEAA